MLGVLRIVLQLEIVYFLGVGYAIAFALTLRSEESIISIAWDSAGVTTGPVTVPFVLYVYVLLPAVSVRARVSPLAPLLFRVSFCARVCACARLYHK